MLSQMQRSQFECEGYLAPLDLCSPAEMAAMRAHTHRRVIGHVAAPEGMEFREMADPAAFDLSEAVNVPLQPGQFLLFSDRTLHHSNANASHRRRLGLAVRYTHTGVRIDLHKSNPGQYGIVVRGRDDLALNTYAKPPGTD